MPSNDEKNQVKPEKSDATTTAPVKQDTPTPLIIVQTDKFINFALTEASEKKNEKKKELED